MNDLREKINRNIHKGIINNYLSNDDLVQIIEQTGSYLNLRTRSAYAKENNLSYNGAKKFRQNVNLFGVNFIVDNI